MTTSQELQRRLALAIRQALDYGHGTAYVDLAGLPAEALDAIAGGGGEPPDRWARRARATRQEADQEEAVLRRLELAKFWEPDTLNARRYRWERIEKLRAQASTWDDLGRRRGAGTLPDSPAAAPSPPDETIAAPAPISAASRG